MKTVVLSTLVCLLVAFPARSQLCLGGDNFSSAEIFDPAWIYGCNTGTSCNGGVAASNKAACMPITTMDGCAPAPSCGNLSFNASDAWFKFYAAGTTATISCFQNSSFVIGIQAFLGTASCGVLSQLGCALAAGPSSGVQLNLTGLTPGALYYFRIFGCASPMSQRTGIYCFCGSTGLSSTILPAAIAHFSATPRGSHINLRWEAASTSNNTMFELERSADGISFTSIASVPALGSAPNAVYGYTDNSPAKGINYYRVKQGATGSPQVSETIQAKTEWNKSFSVQLNPGHATLQLVATAAGDVVLYDAGGRQLQTIPMQAGMNTIAVGQWPAGIYIIRSALNGETQKFYLSR